MNNHTVQTLSPRFRGEILQRIYRVWLFRKLLPVLIAEVIILSLVLYMLGRAVFIQRIMENALTVFFLNPPQIFSFLVSAFANATAATKALTLVAAILAALLLRHLTQGILRLILVKKDYFGRIRT